MTKKKIEPKRPYLSIAGSIMGTLVRQGLLDVKADWRTFKPSPWMEIVEKEIAEYFANKEFKEILDSKEGLKYTGKQISNLQKRIFKKHGLEL